MGSVETQSSTEFMSAELEVDQIGKFPIDRIATIGRAPESSIVLNVRSVSRQHARIFYEGNHFWIKDLGSANGTLVNGNKVKLQMIKDGDKLCFGEIRSVFHSSVRTSGPAPIAKDPMGGIDDFFSDGTPTSGLKGTVPSPCAEAQPLPAEVPISTRTNTIEEELSRKVEALQIENALLREQLRNLREAPSPQRSPSDEDLAAENERLRRAVAQLERALADGNLRIRNLQQRIES